MYTSSNIKRIILILLALGALILIEHLLRDALVGIKYSDWFNSDNLTQEALLSIAFFYSALCAIFLPTPSEAPLLLINVSNICLILIVCGLGKMIGSLVLTLIVRGVLGMSLFHIGAENNKIRYRLTAAIDGRRGLAAYGVCQSIPFLPMRTSTIILAGASKSGRWVYLNIAIISFIGTICRMTIVWQLVRLGLKVFDMPLEMAL